VGYNGNVRRSAGDNTNECENITILMVVLVMAV
jgi:hypothetical protein